MLSHLVEVATSLPSGFVAPTGLSPPVFKPSASVLEKDCAKTVHLPVDCSKAHCYAIPFDYNLTSVGATRVYFSVDGSDPASYNFTNQSCVLAPDRRAGCINTSASGTALMPKLSPGRVFVRALAESAAIKGSTARYSSESCATYEVQLQAPSFEPAGCATQGDPLECPPQDTKSSCTFQVTQSCYSWQLH